MLFTQYSTGVITMRGTQSPRPSFKLYQYNALTRFQIFTAVFIMGDIKSLP